MPRVLLVNGLPGAGKTTVARALGARLGVPVYCKDVVKETLFDWIGAGDMAWSKRIGEASMETIWSLLADHAGDAIVENWFSPPARELVRAGLDRAGAADVLEIWCDVSFDEAFRRFAERAPLRHRGHVEHQVVAEYRQRWSADMGPLEFGPLLRVPTDGPVELRTVVAWVQRHWR